MGAGAVKAHSLATARLRLRIPRVLERLGRTSAGERALDGDRALRLYAWNA